MRFSLDKRAINNFDFSLIAFIVPIVLTSLYLVSEVSSLLFNKQLIYTILSLMVFFVVFFLPIRKTIWLVPFFYWLSIILLISVEFFGVAKLGAKRWIEIPFIHLALQPSEIFKPALILMLAYLIKQNPPPKYGYGWIEFLKLSFFIVLPFLLIAKEPDLGTALIVLLLGFGILFVVGVKRKIWIWIFSIGIVFSLFAYNNLLHGYQKQRIHDFVSEKQNYHIKQSIITIGSSGLWGKDKEKATQTQLKFLPIATSDFIFAYFVERSGFMGGVGLIFMYVAMILHLFMTTKSIKEDYFTSTVIIAVGILLSLYMSINISMTIGLAPVVGVPLPMFSHGGSSFMNFTILFALIENLLAFRFNFLYTSEFQYGFLAQLVRAPRS